MWDLLRGAAQLKQPTPAELGAALRRDAGREHRPAGFRELLDRRPRRRRAPRSGVRAGRRSAAPRSDSARRRATPRRRGAPKCSIWPASRRDHLPDAVAAALTIPLATELALGHVRARRLLARRNASPLRSAGRPDPPDRRADRPRRRADRARVGGAGVAGPARARRAAARRRAAGSASTCSRRKPRSSATRRRRRAACGSSPIRPAHNPIGPFDFAGGYDDRSAPAPGARRADQPRLRGRLPPVHRAGRRRQRRHGSAIRSRNVSQTAEVEACKSEVWRRMKGPATELIHAGETDRGVAVPLTTPIYETTTFVFDNARGGRRLQRRAVVEVPLLALHQPDGRQRRAASSRRSIAPRRRCCSRPGMGATTTILMAHCKARRRGRLQRGDLRRHAAPAAGRAARASASRRASCRSRSWRRRSASSATARGSSGSSRRSTRRCAASTSRAIAGACRARGVLSVIDNTFASPINQQPLALGVDLAMQSATKYLNGHSDVTGGVVTGPAALVGADREGAAAGRHGHGSASGLRARARAEDAAAARRAAQRERAGGRRVPRAATGASASVYYPGLPSHPDHAIAKRQMTGFGGMVCFDLDGGYDARRARLRPAAGHQARRQPRRRREPDQHAGADVAVGAHRRAAARRRRDAGDAAAVGRAWRMRPI